MKKNDNIDELLFECEQILKKDIRNEDISEYYPKIIKMLQLYDDPKVKAFAYRYVSKFKYDETEKLLLLVENGTKQDLLAQNQATKLLAYNYYYNNSDLVNVILSEPIIAVKYMFARNKITCIQLINNPNLIVSTCACIYTLFFMVSNRIPFNKAVSINCIANLINSQCLQKLYEYDMSILLYSIQVLIIPKLGHIFKEFATNCLEHHNYIVVLYAAQYIIYNYEIGNENDDEEYKEKLLLKTCKALIRVFNYHAKLCYELYIIILEKFNVFYKDVIYNCLKDVLNKNLDISFLALYYVLLYSTRQETNITVKNILLNICEEIIIYNSVDDLRIIAALIIGENIQPNKVIVFVELLIKYYQDIPITLFDHLFKIITANIIHEQILEILQLGKEANLHIRAIIMSNLYDHINQNEEIFEAMLKSLLSNEQNNEHNNEIKDNKCCTQCDKVPIILSILRKMPVEKLEKILVLSECKSMQSFAKQLHKIRSENIDYMNDMKHTIYYNSIDMINALKDRYMTCKFLSNTNFNSITIDDIEKNNKQTISKNINNSNDDTYMCMNKKIKSKLITNETLKVEFESFLNS